MQKANTIICIHNTLKSHPKAVCCVPQGWTVQLGLAGSAAFSDQEAAEHPLGSPLGHPGNSIWREEMGTETQSKGAFHMLWTKLPLSPICCPCATPSFQTHEKLNQNPTGRRPLVIQFCLIPSTPPRSAKAFLDPLAFPALQAEPVITPTNIHWGFWAAALWEPAPSQELHTLYKASSWLLEPHSQGSVQSSGCCWQEPSLCAAMSQALQKWWKCEFCSLLLDTIALWFQWLNFFQKLHALEQWSELFKTLLYMSVLSQQLL